MSKPFKNILFSKRNVLIVISALLLFLIKPKAINGQDVNLRWLLPDHYKIQFAGGIGFLSAGLGYDFFKERVDISYFYGYVPEQFAHNELHSVSLQLSGKPFKLDINSKFDYYPLNIGIFLHHTFGEEYYITLPDYYPEDYYWWYPGRTGGFFLEGQFDYQYKDSDKNFSKVGFYYRIVTRGVYLTSKISNSSIPLEDIFSLGLGVVVYY